MKTISLTPREYKDPLWVPNVRRLIKILLGFEQDTWQKIPGLYNQDKEFPTFQS